MRHVPRIGLMLVALAAAPSVHASVSAQEPAALMIRVQGDVDVRHGSADLVRASVGERLAVGDGILPSDGSRAILLTRTGAQMVVTETTTLEEPRGVGNPDIFARAMTALASADEDVTMGGRQGMIRPLGCGVAPVAPRNGILVADGRPVFEWTDEAGDRPYDLMLREIGGSERPRLYEVGERTTFSLPEGEELRPGARYAWTVFAGGREVGRACTPQPEFRVMGRVEQVELQDYLDDISAFGLDPMTDGLFLTAVAYRDVGLLYDAHDALVTVRDRSELSPDLYRLLGEILAELGQEQAAREAYDRANRLTGG